MCSSSFDPKFTSLSWSFSWGCISSSSRAISNVVNPSPFKTYSSLMHPSSKTSIFLVWPCCYKISSICRMRICCMEAFMPSCSVLLMSLFIKQYVVFRHFLLVVTFAIRGITLILEFKCILFYINFLFFLLFIWRINFNHFFKATFLYLRRLNCLVTCKFVIFWLFWI